MRSIITWSLDNVIDVVAAEVAVLRAKDAAGENARSVIEALRRQSEGFQAAADQRARRAFSREGEYHTRRWVASVQASAQVDVSRLLADQDLVDVISIRSEEFNRLIKNLSSDVLNRIERETLGSVFEGRSNVDVARAIRDIEGIGLNRAKLIARDQATKLNSAMNQYRQEQAGVTHYKWRTIIDGRERQTHHDRNNKVFPWSKPPSGGHPGTEINCRCRALPVLVQSEDDIPANQAPKPEPEAPAPPRPTPPPIIPAGRHRQRLAGPSRPVAKAEDEGQAFVLRQGRATRHEWAFAHLDDGVPLATLSSAKKNFVEVDPQILPEIYTGPPRVIFHHNHPGNSSFSGADLEAFKSMPGLKVLYAHGHNGSSYRVTVLKRDAIGTANARANTLVTRYLQSEYNARNITIEQASAMHAHVKALALRKAGFIEYRFSLDGETAVMAASVANVIDRVATNVAADLPH